MADLVLVRRMTATTAKPHHYSHLIGRELTVGYADQNESFAAYLPRTGTAVRQVTVEDWGNDWSVLQLHEPFEYQLGSLDTGFRAATITHFLVRSRWLSMLSARGRLPSFCYWMPITRSTQKISFAVRTSFTSAGV